MKDTIIESHQLLDKAESVFPGENFAVNEKAGFAVASGIVLVTPAKAGQILETFNDDNFRSLSASSARKLADRISDGSFQFNGESLKFRSSGSLCDGQTRLRAVVLAGRSIYTLALFGIDDDLNLDSGQTRSFGQHLAKMKVPSALAVASVTRLVHLHDSGLFSCAFFRGGAGNGRGASSSALMKYFLEHRPEICESVRFISNDPTLRPGSLFSSLHFLFSRKNPTAADKFFKLLETGVGLVDGDPILLLRRQLEAKNKSGSFELKFPNKAALTIKAWNAWLKGNTMRHLVWRSTGPTSEAFPEIS